MNWRKNLFDPGRSGSLRDFGLLMLRIGFAVGVATHGWGKLLEFGQRAGQFPDPLGLGSQVSLALVVFAEFFCSVLLLVGLMSRLASVPLVITFVVAFFLVHGGDPFGQKEKAFLYLVAFAGLLVTGPGRFSMDALIAKR